MERATLPGDEVVGTSPQFGTVQFEGLTVPASVFHGLGGRRWEWLRLAFAAIAFAVTFSFFIVALEPGWIRYVVLSLWLFMAGFWFLGLWSLRTDIGRIALSAEGLHAGNRSEIFVPWAVILTARHRRWLGMGSIDIRVSDPNSVRLPAVFRIMQLHSRRFGGSDLDIRPGQGGADECAATIAFYLEHPEERANIGRRLPVALSLPTARTRARWQQVAIRALRIIWFAYALAFLALIALFVLIRLAEG